MFRALQKSGCWTIPGLMVLRPMMSCSLSPNVDDAKVADVVIPHVLRRPHVQGPQYMHKFLLVDRSSKL